MAATSQGSCAFTQEKTMHTNKRLYTIRTRTGFKFQIEASSPAEAEIRARHPVIARTVSRILSDALAQVAEV